MHERDNMFFLRFFLILDSSLIFVNDSDFMNRPLRTLLLRKLELDGPSNDADLNVVAFSNRFKSISVCEALMDRAKTSLIKSG